MQWISAMAAIRRVDLRTAQCEIDFASESSHYVIKYMYAICRTLAGLIYYMATIMKTSAQTELLRL